MGLGSVGSTGSVFGLPDQTLTGGLPTEFRLPGGQILSPMTVQSILAGGDTTGLPPGAVDAVRQVYPTGIPPITQGGQVIAGGETPTGTGTSQVGGYGGSIGKTAGSDPAAISAAIAAEGQRDLARGNLIGDSFQASGAAARTDLAAEANAQQYRGNVIGDSLQNRGLAAAAGMNNLSLNAQRTGSNYADQGAASNAQQQLDRLGQIAAGDAGYGAGRAQMQASDMYGSQAAGAAGQLQGTLQAQMGIGGTAGAMGGQNFAQGNTYGAMGQADYAAQAMARMQQLANGQQGAAYGAGNMGTSGALLGQAGQDYGAQAGSRAAQMGAVGRLQDFYQQGPGPSVAEAQLKQSTDQNMANAISLARSGRGAGDNASAMRQAMFSNAATQQQAGMQAAQLRAQETDAYRGRQLQAMGQEQSTLGNLRGQDQSIYGQNVGAAGQFAGLGYQGLGLGQQGATSARQGDLSAMGQNQSAQQGLYGLGYQGAGLQAQQANTVAGQQLTQQQAYLQQQNAQGALGYQGYGLNAQQENQARGMDLTAMQAQNQTGLGYAQLGQGYQQLGQQTQMGYAGLANQQYMTSDQIAAQERNAAIQTQLQYTGLANDQYQTADQLRNQQMLAQLSSDTSRYGADKNVSIAQAQMAAQKQAAQLAAAGSLAAGVIQMSDIRSKENIEEEQFFNVKGQARKKRKPKGIVENLFGLKDEGFEDAEDKNYVPLDDEDKPSLLRQMAKQKGPAAPPGPAPWEMGISPFATQAPPESPYIQPEPTGPYQPRTVNLDFNRFASSDEREKEHAFRAGMMAGKGADLRPAQGYSYDYKNPQAPGAAPGRHFGPMAQDLEKTPAGKSVVQTGKDGMKSIDTSRLSLVNTSAISEQQRRLDRLEQLAGMKKPPRDDLAPTSEQLARSGETMERPTAEFLGLGADESDGELDQNAVDFIGTADPDPDKRRIGRAGTGGAYLYDRKPAQGHSNAVSDERAKKKKQPRSIY